MPVGREASGAQAGHSGPLLEPHESVERLNREATYGDSIGRVPAAQSSVDDASRDEAGLDACDAGDVGVDGDPDGGDDSAGDERARDAASRTGGDGDDEAAVVVVHHAAYVAVSSLAVVVVVLDDAADAVAGGRDLLLTITLQCRRLSRQSHHSLHLHLRSAQFRHSHHRQCHATRQTH